MSAFIPTILSVIAVLGLTACGAVPVVPVEEAPLQPAAVCPSSFEDPAAPAGKEKSL